MRNHDRETLRFRYCPYDGEQLRDSAVEQGSRPSCPRCEFVDYANPLPVVAAVVLKDTRILLARRGKPPQKGTWDIPGGFMEAGERIEDALAREVKEETGMEVEVGEYLGSLPDVYGPLCLPTVNLCFLAHAVGGSTRAGSDVADVAWFDTGNLPAQDVFPHREHVVAWLNGRRHIAD
jgi:ADP-ribose pyrophosphatase YjhB (NUDIX family)